MREWPRARFLSRALLDVFFPIACVGCGRYERGWLCADCGNTLGGDRPRCSVCSADAPTGRTCHRCRPHTPLDGVVAVGPYRDPTLQSAIKTYKFHGVRRLALTLGDLLAKQLVSAGLSTGTLIPLPLHRRRERTRGFNQAKLLAEAVSACLNLEVADLLVRTRATSPQTSILESPKARGRNVAGAFAIAEIGNRMPQAESRMPTRAILIDDVYTTGATVTEAARVLREAGTAEVWAAVVARG